MSKELFLLQAKSKTFEDMKAKLDEAGRQKMRLQFEMKQTTVDAEGKRRKEEYTKFVDHEKRLKEHHGALQGAEQASLRPLPRPVALRWSLSPSELYLLWVRASVIVCAEPGASHRSSGPFGGRKRIGPSPPLASWAQFLCLVWPRETRWQQALGPISSPQHFVPSILGLSVGLIAPQKVPKPLGIVWRPKRAHPSES